MRSLPPEVPEGPRADILSCVQEVPGIHLRQVERQTGLALGQVLYHLDRLQRMGLVTVTRDRGFKRFFPEAVVGRAEKPFLAALRHKTPRHILLALLKTPDQSHKELQQKLGIAGSTLSFHLRRLVEMGVLIRRRRDGSNVYEVADADVVKQQLVDYHASFEDDKVDAFVALEHPAEDEETSWLLGS